MTKRHAGASIHLHCGNCVSVGLHTEFGAMAGLVSRVRMRAPLASIVTDHQGETFMHIYPSTRRRAAFKIFEEVVRDEPAVDADEFWHLWQKTGLRYADCQLALDELVRKGYLCSTQRATRTVLTLTEAGMDEIKHSHTPLARRLRDWLTLSEAQARRGRHGGLEHRGRSSQVTNPADDPTGPTRH